MKKRLIPFLVMICVVFTGFVIPFTSYASNIGEPVKVKVNFY